MLVINKMLVIRADNHKILVKIANREDTDQTASSARFISFKNCHNSINMCILQKQSAKELTRRDPKNMF